MLRTLWWIFLAGNSLLLSGFLSFLAGISLSTVSILGLLAVCGVGIGCFYLLSKLAKTMGTTGFIATSLAITACAGLLFAKFPTNAMIVNAFAHHQIATILGLCLFYTAAFIGVTMGAAYVALNVADKFFSWAKGDSTSQLTPPAPNQPKTKNTPPSPPPGVTRKFTGAQPTNDSYTRKTGTPFSFHRPATESSYDDEDPSLRAGSHRFL